MSTQSPPYTCAIEAACSTSLHHHSFLHLLVPPVLAVGTKKYCNVTLYNKPHTRALLGEGQVGDSLVWVRSSRKLNMRWAYIGFLGEGVFQSGLVLEGFLWPDVEASLGIGGILWPHPGASSWIGGILCSGIRKDWWVLCSGVGGILSFFFIYFLKNNLFNKIGVGVSVKL